MSKIKAVKLVSLLFTFALGVGAGVPKAIAGEVVNPSDILKCSDGTFNYTTASMSTREEAPHLIRVRLTSQEQAFVRPLVPDLLAERGSAVVSFYLSRSECQHSPENAELMSCETRRNGYLEVAYDENPESRRIRKLPMGVLKLQTTVAGNAFHLDLTLTQAGSNQASVVHLEFPVLENGSCRPF